MTQLDKIILSGESRYREPTPNFLLLPSMHINTSKLTAGPMQHFRGTTAVPRPCSLPRTSVHYPEVAPVASIGFSSLNAGSSLSTHPVYYYDV